MPQKKPTNAEIRPSNRYGFLLPRRLSGNFNAAGQLVEVQALPNYVRETVEAKDLADFRLVLGGLAQPGNRDTIFPVDLEQHVESPDSESERRTLDIVEGKSAMGFNIAVLAARNEANKPVYLYVVEDSLRHMMVVAGPEKISGAMKKALEKAGVSYVVRKDDDCAAVVDDFLAEGAKHRNENGFLLSASGRSTQSVITDLVRSVSAVVEINDAALEGKGPVSYWGSTLGRAISQAGSQPVCYTSIVRTPQS
jgi:hypothetical protein